MASDNRNGSPRDKRPANNNNNPQEPRNSGGNFLGRSWFWLVLAVLVLFGSRFLFSRPTDTSNMIGLNEVARHVENGDVNRLPYRATSLRYNSKTVIRITTRDAAARRMAKVSWRRLTHWALAMNGWQNCRLLWKIPPTIMQSSVG